MTRAWAVRMLALANPVERRSRLMPLPMTSMAMKSLMRFRLPRRPRRPAKTRAAAKKR
jgi:hypothetical protein